MQSVQYTQRVIGKYRGGLHGPLLIVTAGMHGNEPAGVRALDLMFKMLEVEHITNPAFEFNGEIIGIIGNLAAFNQRKRYISKDINRSWHHDYIESLKQKSKKELTDEDIEMLEVLETLNKEIYRVEPDHIYFLDVHTTSSDGGIFSITTRDEESIMLAHQIHAPIVLGLLKDIQGTTLQYFNKEHLGVSTTSIAFEGGHHDDPMSINRIIAAIINVMRAIHMVKPEDVENRHDHVLTDYSKQLPSIVEVVYKYHVDDNALWQMKPGFKNFQSIVKGDILARYDGQYIYAPCDGMILMPLYQSQGSDGFFIVVNKSSMIDNIQKETIE